MCIRDRDITRVIPVCAVTGEAAGTAAAMLVKQKKASFSELNVAQLQNTIRDQGGILEPDLTRKGENRL